MSGPTVVRTDGVLSTVNGTFYRAVDPAREGAVLRGSRTPGRYSPADAPTLYVSSSRNGVSVAMKAHLSQRPAKLHVVTLLVEADNVFDLRDSDALAIAGIDLADTAAPWQDVVAAGGTPPSWHVRRRLESLGAYGLIDPSRQQPGLWHLALFRWNTPGAPSVRTLITPGQASSY